MWVHGRRWDQINLIFFVLFFFDPTTRSVFGGHKPCLIQFFLSFLFSEQAVCYVDMSMSITRAYLFVDGVRFPPCRKQ